MVIINDIPVKPRQRCTAFGTCVTYERQSVSMTIVDIIIMSHAFDTDVRSK